MIGISNLKQYVLELPVQRDYADVFLVPDVDDINSGDAKEKVMINF
jgi:hypothetical protein